MYSLFTFKQIIYSGIGPHREHRAYERVIQSIPLHFGDARWAGQCLSGRVIGTGPRTLLVRGLKPQSTYRIIVTGVCADDTARRTGSFRTNTKCTQKSKNAKKDKNGATLNEQRSHKNENELRTQQGLRFIAAEMAAADCGTSVVLDPSIYDESCDDVRRTVDGVRFRTNTSSSSTNACLITGLTITAVSSSAYRFTANNAADGDGRACVWKELWHSTVRLGRSDVRE